MKFGIILACTVLFACSEASAENTALDAAFPQIPLPAGAPEPPIEECDDVETCTFSQAEFTRQDWPKAWSGDYQAQRNVAFCLSTGCDGAVKTDQVAACAWRIVASGHPQSDDTDAGNQKMDCGRLNDLEREGAASLARNLPTGR